jgi:O-antigen ligase
VTQSRYLPRFTEALSVFLLIVAFLTIQTLIGGTRLLFSLPAYAIVALVGLLSLFSLRRPKPPADWLCLGATVLFLGYVLARALLSPVDYLARSDIYSVVAGLIVYFSVASVLTDSKRRMAIFLCLLGFALVHVVVGGLQFRDGENFMPISFLQRYDYGRRASGLYVCPNHLAGLLEVLAVFGLSLICWSRWSRWLKLLVGYAVAVCYLGVALTGSRGGYLSTVASVICFAGLSLLLLWQAPRRLFWTFAIPSGLLALLLAGAVVFFIQRNDVLSERANNVLDVGNIRFDLWKAASQQWHLQPVFGTGSGTYLYYGRQFRTDRVQIDPVYVHNDYLQLLAEYGVIACVLLILFLAVHLRNGWKNFVRLGPNRVGKSQRLLSNGLALQVGALSAVVAYLVHSVFDFNLHIPANLLLMAFVFGILANPGPIGASQPQAPRGATLFWRLVAPALAVVICIQCVRFLPGEYYTEKARTALRDYDPGAAIHFGLQGLKWEQRNPDLYQYLGSAQLDQADELTDPAARASMYEAAIDTFKKGRVVAPREKSFAMALGMAYDELGRFPEGEWMLDEAMNLDPKFAPARDVYQEHLRRWRGEKRAAAE